VAARGFERARKRRPRFGECHPKPRAATEGLPYSTFDSSFFSLTSFVARHYSPARFTQTLIRLVNTGLRIPPMRAFL